MRILTISLTMLCMTLFACQQAFAETLNSAVTDQPTNSNVQRAPMTEIDNDKPIQLDSSQREVTIHLNSNPSTGFSWFLLDYDPRLIKPLGRKFTANTHKHLIGAPGTEDWRFQLSPAALVVPSIVKVKLMYTRPFALNTGHVKQITLITPGKSVQE